MTKIGIDAHVLGKGVGGVERFVREVMLRLAMLTPEFDYVIFLNKHEYNRLQKTQHYPPLNNVVYVPLAVANPLIERSILMPWLCRKYKLDALFVQRLLPWFCGNTKQIVAIHDLTPIKFPKQYAGLTNKLVRLLTPGTVQRADLILTPTAAIGAEIQAFYGSFKADVLAFYNGVDTQVFKPATLAKDLTHLGINAPYLLTAGAIERRKNIETLFDMLPLLTAYPRLKLVVVGGIRDQAYALELKNKVIALGLQNQVISLGYLAEADLIALYQQAELFITASRDEGFNLPPLEAMACGTAVVCSDIAVHHELFDACAAFFATESAQNLAQVVDNLLSNQAARQLLITAANQRIADFTWDASAARIALSFKNLLPPTSLLSS